jgi:hypothetical protein
LLIAASISLCANHHPRGIIQPLIVVKTPNIEIRDVSTEAIKPFHFPNYPSTHLVNGSLMWAFLTTSLTKIISPWRAFVSVPLKAVFWGIITQHFLRSIIQTTPSLPELYSKFSYFSKPLCWCHPTD